MHDAVVAPSRSGAGSTPEGRPHTSHVPALDGMRAVGVILVFLFHLNVRGFGAGFLGVDIFFVLSGFLITSLLLNEMDSTGRVRLAAFWSRRVRRLLPALVILLLVIAAVTAATATYSERQSVRGDLLATTTYVANWRFISTGSYFENTGVESPLQHTWSLGIEEQFYLLWPLLLVLLLPLLRRPRLTVLVPAALGAVASTALLALLWEPGAADRAYMGTDARIVEPLLGAIAAVVIASPKGRAFVQRWGVWMATIGAAGLLGLLVVIRPDTSFYYYGGAVLVSVCTAAVMAALWLDRGGVLHHVLEWPPIVFLGVISYGVYLWHWPFILWLGVRNPQVGNALARSLLAVALTIGVATASFYVIERPIRRGRQVARHAAIGPLRRRPVLVLALVPVVMMSVIGVSLAATTVPPPPPGVPVLMIVGDSVPLRLEPALEQMATLRGWRVASAARGACPVTGEEELSADGEPIHEAHECPGVPAEQDALIQKIDPDIVVWWDRWSLSSFIAANGTHVTTGTPAFWKARRKALRAAVSRLSVDGAMVLFVATEPPGIAAGERCEESWCPAWRQFQIDRYHDITTRWNGILRRYAQQHSDVAAFASVTSVVCRTDIAPCDDRIDGTPARPDGTHYGGPGVNEVVGALAGFLPALLARARG